jgi:ATP-dependent Clp protease protease subunit
MDDATTNALLKSRCVLLRGEITEESARDCMAQLLFLGYGASTLTATLFVDSPGGHVGAAVALLRTMSELPYPLATHCLGAAGGAAAAIVAHGRPGMRTSVPEARFAFAPSSADAAHGYVEAEFAQCDTALLEFIAEDAHKHEEEVATLFRVEALLTAEEALKFGLIDAISGEPACLPAE